MYKTAIVEDETDYADLLSGYLDRLAQEKQVSFQICRFTNAVSFLENYTADYDLVFMDIRMPYLNGMDASRRLRELDTDVLLIFITSLAQYAIRGYEVDALDYILKPVSYFDFALKMNRALKRMYAGRKAVNFLISTTDGKIRLSLDEIRYVESQGHHLLYHVAQGRTHTQYATLSSVEQRLALHYFVRCNNCYLVNLKYVSRVKGYTVTVDGTDLQISQPRKKEFISRLTSYPERSQP